VARNYYIKFQGKTQGQIKGSSTKPKRIDWVELTDCDWGAVVPKGTSKSGTTGGHTKHPITITKEVDAASPLLYQALVTNEVLQIIIEETEASNFGAETVTKRMTLTNASVAYVKAHMPPLSGERPENTHGKPLQDVGLQCTAFAYEVVSAYDAASGLPSGKRQH
jgi:type VI secretion system secreted protein Hcp